MDQFRFIDRIRRSIANTRLSVRAPRLSTFFRSPLVIGSLASVSLLWATRPAFADERRRPDKKWVGTWGRSGSRWS
jgi:hypothetical protein